jgi:predicted transcriptional regulator
MVGNRVGAVPVVGERSEVLGIITAGDVLDQLLRDSPTEDSPPARDRLRARDFMTRTVLCVAEGQPLKDAARMMVNKKIEQLPVVREGELIGIVTRSKVLRALHGSGKKTEESCGRRWRSSSPTPSGPGRPVRSSLTWRARGSR